MTSITLPWPPSVNRYWRSAMGRVLISVEGRRYRHRVLAKALDCRVQKTLGKLRVDIIASPPDKRRRDLDNLLKATLDSLTHGGAWEDDSQIVDLRIRWGEQVEGGLLHVSWEVADFLISHPSV